MVWIGSRKILLWFLMVSSGVTRYHFLCYTVQDRNFLTETHYTDYSEILSAAVSKTVRQKTLRQKEPAMVNAFMLHPLIHTSLYLPKFLSLRQCFCPWVFLSLLVMSLHPFILSLSICPCVRLPKLYQPNITMKLSLFVSTFTANSGKLICDSRSVSFAQHVFFQLAEAPLHYSEEHLGNHNSHGPAQKLMETHLRFFRGRFQKEPLPQEGSEGVVVFIPGLKEWIGQKIRQTNGWVEW